MEKEQSMLEEEKKSVQFLYFSLKSKILNYIFQTSNVSKSFITCISIDFEFIS